MRSLRPGVRRSRSDQPHRRSGRSRVTFYHPTRAFALHVEPKRNRRRSKIALRCRRTGRGSEQRCQNLSASGGCSRAQVHWRTQDDGLDRHASIRVSGPKKDGKTTSAFEALNSEKENIMSIIRHEIRQISDENRGQPRCRPESGWNSLRDLQQLEARSEEHTSELQSRQYLV